MATHIICPACDTRYETKAVFPPEGRKVRCSKCGHVWQAHPVTVPPPAARPVQMTPPAPPPQAAKPPQAPPPPKPAAPVNAGLSGFAGIAPAARSAPPAPPPQPPSFARPDIDADLAAQLARLNADAMADTPPAAPPEKSGGIFSRLSRQPSAAPVAPPPDAGMDDASMVDASFGGDALGAGMGNGLGDAGMDASMGEFGMDADLNFDPALAAQALPGEQPLGPRRVPSIVTVGWLVLGLVVALVIGTLVLAPSAVMSVLPGAARLYALFGAPVGAHGLTFEGVRYGWTSEGGQTVLEVQGDVVNTTTGAVDVPTVVIALRDEGGEEISEWTTEVGAEQLAGGEHAPFLRQIPSPPSNVRSVKVRFAKAE